MWCCRNAKMHGVACFEGTLPHTVVGVSDVGHFAEANVYVSFERGIADV